MKQRSLSLPVLVVVAVVALVLGSIGTAVAGPALTKGKVKKIAAKVVAQKASGLSVANAANLNGKPATSYLNGATIFGSTTAVPAMVHVITIPLAPGNYTIGYSVLMVAGTGYSYCQIRRTRGAVSINIADDTAESTDSASVSSYGALDVAAGDLVTLRCNSSTPFTIGPVEPAQIIVTPLDTLTAVATPLVAAKGTAGTGARGTN